MTTIAVGHEPKVLRSLLQMAVSVPARIAHAVYDSRKKRQASRKVSKLTAHQLEDIGLVRNEIHPLS